MKSPSIFALLAALGCGCGTRASAPDDPAPGFGRVQAMIDARDLNDPIPRLHLATHGPTREDKLILSDAAWKRRLPPARYAILRGGGTEKPKSSPLAEERGQGVFRCAACGNPLFGAGDKYESGSGWPSFFRPAKADAVWYRLDRTDGLHQVELLCARCDSHLGHVFDDAPRKLGGLRYCVDGAALTFAPAPKGETIPPRTVLKRL